MGSFSFFQLGVFLNFLLVSFITDALTILADTNIISYFAVQHLNEFTFSHIQGKHCLSIMPRFKNELSSAQNLVKQ